MTGKNEPVMSDQAKGVGSGKIMTAEILWKPEFLLPFFSLLSFEETFVFGSAAPAGGVCPLYQEIFTGKSREFFSICTKTVHRICEKIVDSLKMLCYSEECYIMARYAYLSFLTDGIVL